MNAQQIVAKLWNYCNVLRDDGLSYGDYVEQLTYLLFLKMAHERTQAPWKEKSVIPAGYDWPALLAKEGDALEVQYRKTLETLGKQEGMLGIVFRKAQNKIQDPANLRRLVADLIDREEWIILDADVKRCLRGTAGEERTGHKRGSGQYLTLRPLIQAIVECVQPKYGETIFDPACGTGGFLLAAHAFIAGGKTSTDKALMEHLRLRALRGIEIVDSVARLCAMNHGIGPTKTSEGETPVRVDDSLKNDAGVRYDVVLTNPPFARSRAFGS